MLFAAAVNPTEVGAQVTNPGKSISPVQKPANVSAQQPTNVQQTSSQTYVAKENLIEAQHQVLTATLARLEAELRAGNASLADVAEGIKSLKANTEAAKSPWSAGTLVPALSAIFGILVGGVMNFLALSKLADKRSNFELRRSIVKHQLKQRSQLYGPLRSLLDQSFSLYRQMNRALEHRDPGRFRLVAGGDDLDGQAFEIFETPGGWVRFRTVMHLKQVYGLGMGVDPYFDEIVALGKHIARVIERKSGLASAGDGDLVEAFGQYLAHIAMLKSVYASAKNSPGSSVAKVDESAAYPTRLHKLVKDGYKLVNDGIEQWSEVAQSGK